MPARLGKCFGSSSTKACVEPESNQTSQMSSTFFQSSLAREPRKRSRAPALYQASAPSCSKASAMRLFTASSCRISAEPSAFSRTNTAIGTPQARWREITQSGRLSIMPVMRFSPAAGTQRVVLISLSAMPRKVPSQPLDRLVHGDEPLRRVAEDDGLLRAPGVRVLMLQPAARDDLAGGGERLDDGLVGVALLALVVDDALALEAGGVRGERAVLIDGVGNRRIDAARLERRAHSRSRFRSPRGRGRARCARSPCRRRR